MVEQKRKRIEQGFDEALLRVVPNSTIGASLRDFLPAIGRVLGCEWGVCWELNSGGTLLLPAFIWTDHERFAALEGSTRGRVLSVGEGTAGQVWRAGKPRLSHDLTFDMSLPRSLYAMKCGFGSGVWFPIQASGGGGAVLELLGNAIEAPDSYLLQALETLGERVARTLGHSTTCGA